MHELEKYSDFAVYGLPAEAVAFCCKHPRCPRKHMEIPWDDSSDNLQKIIEAVDEHIKNYHQNLE